MVGPQVRNPTTERRKERPRLGGNTPVKRNLPPAHPQKIPKEEGTPSGKPGIVYMMEGKGLPKQQERSRAESTRKNEKRRKRKPHCG